MTPPAAPSQTVDAPTAPRVWERIPSPPGRPLVGNLLQAPRDALLQHAVSIAPRYDGVFALDLAGVRAIFVSSADAVADLCDETRYRKVVVPPLSHLRPLAGDGLFTAHSDEENWGKAHRVLLPAFSPKAMKGYYDAMLEVAGELVAAWDGKADASGPDADIAVTDDMTRLTLDTIALTGFGQRFESFRSPELHPFLQAMGRVLTDAQSRITRLPGTDRFYARRQKRVDADIAAMDALVDEVVAARRADPSGAAPTDLLGLMLGARDPETGEALDDVNVRRQIHTFLIAGHETTSGLLSFALYQLLRNPHVLAQAYAEVDRVLPGDTVPSYRDVSRLDVIGRVLDETLRLWSPAPGFTVAPYAETVLAGRHRLRADRPVNVLLGALHRDPGPWPDPERFDPDRFLPEAVAARTERWPHSYKPFGNGARACIGRQFALVEARLALALVLQRFALEDPHDYRLDVKQALTIKPVGFRIRVRRRRAHERLTAAAPAPAPTEPDTSPATGVPALAATGTALTVLYGSTMGTCAEIAQTVAERGEAAGFATTVRPLDALVEAADEAARDGEPGLGGTLPRDGLVVVVTATYNGEAPDGARRFDAAVREGRLDDRLAAGLGGSPFALLGCGNTQWATYQAFPKRVEAALLAAGATPLLPRAEADAAGDFDGDLERWAGDLVAAVTARYGGTAFAEQPAEPRFAVEVLDDRDARPGVVPERAHPLRVVANDELLGDPAGLWDHAVEAPLVSTRHVVLELPDDDAATGRAYSYKVGDHVALFARNDPALVARVAARFGLTPASVVRLDQRHGRTSALPVGAPVEVGRLLGEFVELQDVATRSDVRLLAASTPCPATRADLEGLAGDDAAAEARFRAEVLDRHASLLDLLERFPAVDLPLGAYLERCSPIRPRYYSISSSPAQDPRRLSLTVGVLDGPARSGTGQYKGLTSGFVRRLAPGDVVSGYVRTPAPPFRPPADPATPVVMVGPGTGVAPFRGFLADRAAARARGEAVGAALLVTGSRHPGHDAYYTQEFRAWGEAGLVAVRSAFSALPDHPHRYAQDVLAACGDEVWALLTAGAHLYLCGDGVRMAPAVRQALLDLHAARTGGTAEQAQEWLAGLQAEGRYAEDVFAPSR